jgi:hypothetical protein
LSRRRAGSCEDRLETTDEHRWTQMDTDEGKGRPKEGARTGHRKHRLETTDEHRWTQIKRKANTGTIPNYT